MNASEDRHTRDLAQQLAEANATIDALLSGQIDAVVDATNGNPVLLAKAQDALRDSEARYRYIVETTNEGVWLIDARHRTIFMNRRMAEMLGCEADMGVGRSPFDFVDDAGRATLAAHIEHPGGHRGEVRYVRTDGTSIWTLVDETPIFDDARRPNGSLAIVKNITDTRQAEAALQASLEEFRSLAESMPQIVWITRPDGENIYFNQQWMEYTGLTLEESLGTGWSRPLHPDDRPAAQDAWRRATATDGIYSIESRVRRADGVYRWWLVRGVPVHDATGHILKWFGTCTDIHDLKLVEAERTAVAQRLSLATGVARVGVWDWERASNTLTWDATMFDMYGFTPIVPMQYAQWAAAVHPEDLPGVEATRQRVIEEKSEGTTEFRIVRVDGSVRHISAVERVILDAQNNVGRVVGVNVDVTERRGAEAAMRTARDAAEQSNRAKSEFLANMSHEIRTPMNGVIGMTDLVLDSELTAEQRQQLRIVKSSADALLGVINDILDFSRIEAGKLVLDPTLFTARDAITDTANSIAWRANEKGLEFIVDIGADVPIMLHGDRGRLRQILVNLLGNAIKFTDRGEVVLRVRPESGPAPTVVLHFAIRDTGIGIPLERQDIVFQPFTQADGSITRAFGGTGLGLTIASQLVTLMGGRLWMESAPGRGTTFHFTARFGRVAAQHTVRQPLMAARILIVADHAVNRLLARRLLEKRGHSVVAINDRREALALLAARSGEFSCVLVDLQMPETGMGAFVASIRERERTAGGRLPIIAMIAHEMKGDDLQRLEAGMDGYVSTPIQPDELYAIVEGYIGSSC